MYTINFFTLKILDEDKYLEDIEEYELKLSSLDDVKSFLSSDFYENVYDHLFSYLDGIVINKGSEVVYKELFSNAVKYEIFKTDDQIIYKEIGENNDDYEDVDRAYIIVDKLNEVKQNE